MNLKPPFADGSPEDAYTKLRVAIDKVEKIRGERAHHMREADAAEVRLASAVEEAKLAAVAFAKLVQANGETPALPPDPPAGNAWPEWEGGILGLAKASKTWTDEQLADALIHFGESELVEEASVISEERLRRSAPPPKKQRAKKATAEQSPPANIEEPTPAPVADGEEPGLFGPPVAKTASHLEERM